MANTNNEILINTRVNTDITEAEKSLSRVNKELFQLTKQHSIKVALSRDIEEQITKTEDRIRELQEKFAGVTKENGLYIAKSGAYLPTQEYKAAEDELKKLEKEHDSLIKKVESAERAVSQLNDEIADKENDRSGYEQELSQLYVLQAKRAKELSGRYEEINAIDTLTRKIELLTREKNRLINDADDESKILSKTEQISRLSAQLDNLKAQESKASELSNRYKEEISDIDALTRKIELLKQERDAVINSGGDESRVIAKTEQIKKLSAQLENLKTQEERSSELSNRYKEELSDIDALTRKIELLTKEKDALISDGADESKVLAKTEQIKKLTSQLDDLRASESRAKEFSDRYKEEVDAIDTLTRRIELLQQEREALINSGGDETKIIAKAEQIKKLSAQLASLQTQEERASELSSRYEEINQIDTLTRKLELLRQEKEELISGGGDESKIIAKTEQINRVSAQLDKLKAQTERATDLSSRYNEEINAIDTLTRKIELLKQERDALINNGGDESKIIAKTEQIQKLTAELGNLSTQEERASELAGRYEEINAIDTLARKIELLKQERDALIQSGGDETKIIAKTEQINRLTAQLEKLKAEAASTPDSMDKTTQAMERTANASEKTVSAVEKFGNRIAGLVKRVFVFSLITKGLRQVRTWFDKVLKTNGEAQAAMGNLKAAVMTFIQPLVQVVIPVLTKIMNVLSALFYYASKAISAIFGISFKNMLGGAQQLYDSTNGTADNFDKANESAKELKRTLASFDNLEILQDDDEDTKLDSLANGAGGGLGGEVQPNWNFANVITDEIKKIAVLTSIGLIAVGLILIFSGVGVGVGLAMLVMGALALYGAVNEDWDFIKEMLQGQIGDIMIIVGGALIVVGLLCLVGGAIGIGLGCIIAGAGLLAITATARWTNLKDFLEGPIGQVLKGISVAMVLIGLICLFIPGKAPIGIGLIIFGIASYLFLTNASEQGLNVSSVQEALEGPIGTALKAMSIGVALVGLIMLFVPTKALLGAGLLVAGLATYLGIVHAQEQGLDVSSIQEALEGPIGTVLKALTIGMVLIGLVLLFIPTKAPLGMGLIMGGMSAYLGITGAQEQGLDFSSLQTILEGPIGTVLKGLTLGAVLIGIMMMFIPGKMFLGAGLILAGLSSYMGLLSASEQGLGDTSSLQSILEGPIGSILTGLALGMVLIGIICLFIPSKRLLGIGLIAVGVAGYAALLGAGANPLQGTAIADMLNGPLLAALEVISGMFVVLGIILCCTGPQNIPLGIGLIAVGAVGLATAIIPNWANNPLIQELKEFKKKNDELADSIENTKKKYEEEHEQIGYNAEAAKVLAEKLFTLKDRYDGTAEKSDEIKGIVEELNELVPGLGASWDGVTGSLNMTNAELLANIDLLSAQAEASALMDYYTESLKQQLEAEDRLAEAQKKMNDILGEYGLTQQDVNAYLQGGQPIMEALNKKIVDSGHTWFNFNEIMTECQLSVEAYNGANENFIEASDHVVFAEDKLAEAHKKAQTATENAAAAAEEAAKTAAEKSEEVVEAADNVNENVDFQEVVDKAETAGKEAPEKMTTGLTEGKEDVKQAASDLESAASDEFEELPDKMGEAGKSGSKNLNDGFYENYASLVETVDKMYQIFTMSFGELPDEMSEAGSEGGNKLNNGFLDTHAIISGTVDKIYDIFQLALHTYLPGKMWEWGHEAGSHYTNGLNEGFNVDDLTQTIESHFSTSSLLWNTISYFFYNLKYEFVSALNECMYYIEQASYNINNGLVNIVNNLNRVAQQASSISNGSYYQDYGTFYGSSLSRLPYPAYAQGTVIPPNSLHLAFLGDNKKEPEVVSPVSTMKQAFKEAMQELGGMNGNVNVYLDGKQLSDAVSRWQNRSQRAFGM